MGINIKEVTNEQIVRDLPGWYLATGKWRVLPSFLIAGVQKGGTTSLVQYLQSHPSIIRPKRKDIFFFNNLTRYNKGINFYRAFFPLTIQQTLINGIRGRKTQTFDGTPNYLDSPGAAHRIEQMLPNVKIVLLLRNPVTRAYSNYNMALKFGFETLPFYEALMVEEERVAWFEKSEFFKGHNFVHQRLAYRKRGEYSNFLPDWLTVFKDRIHIEFTENLENQPHETYHRILHFLGLEEQKIEFKIFNKGEYKNKMEDKCFEYLNEHFKPHNTALKQMLNTELPW